MADKIIANLDKIWNFQKSRGFSDGQFADKMGISRALMCRVKNGSRNVSSAFIAGLIRAGMKPEDIFLPK